MPATLLCVLFFILCDTNAVSSTKNKSRILLLGGGHPFSQSGRTPKGPWQFTAESFYPSDPNRNRLEPRPTGPEIEHATAQQAQVHRGNIYLVGGADTNESVPHESNDRFISNTTYMINVANWSVSLGPDTIAPRAGAGSVLVKNSMFLCGGADQMLWDDDDVHILNTCEMLPLGQLNATWQPVASMKSGRMGHAMAALDGHVFAMGGWVVEGSAWLNPTHSESANVECYSVAQNRWEMLGSSMLVRRMMSVATVFNGHITICGAQWSKTYACEFYNNQKWQWFSLPGGMKEARTIFNLVEWNGKLVALGNMGSGRTKPDPNATSVEIFDPEIGKWSLCSEKLVKNRWFASAVVV